MSDTDKKTPGANAAAGPPKVRKSAIFLAAFFGLLIGGGAGWLGAPMLPAGGDTSHDNGISAPHRREAGTFFFQAKDSGHGSSFSAFVEVDLAEGQQSRTFSEIRNELYHMFALVSQAPAAGNHSKLAVGIEESVKVMLQDRASWIKGIEIKPIERR